MLFLKINDKPDYINPEQITSIKATNHALHDYRITCKYAEFNGEYTDPDYIELLKINIGTRYDKLSSDKQKLLDQLADKIIINLIEQINNYKSQGISILDIKKHFKRHDAEIQQILKEIGNE